MCGNSRGLGAIFLAAVFVAGAAAQEPRMVLDRKGFTVGLEPYAPNVVRVTLSTIGKSAVAPPGYGFVASPSAQGWAPEKRADADVYRSTRLIVSAGIDKPHPLSGTHSEISK